MKICSDQGYNDTGVDIAAKLRHEFRGTGNCPSKIVHESFFLQIRPDVCEV